MKMGRPRLPRGKSKDIQVCVRLTPCDNRLVEQLSKKLKANKPEVLRQALGYISFLSELDSSSHCSETSKACKRSIREMDRKGYRVLSGEELEKERQRMEYTGFMTRHKIPFTLSGVQQAYRLKDTHCNVFKKV